MCGRFTLIADLSDIVQYFHIETIPAEYKTGKNISPGQLISAVIHSDVNKLVNFRWGLIPSSAKDPSIGNRMINARAETVAEKPSFRDAFRRRRCLIIADGFYEWEKLGKVRKPLKFSLKSGKPFGFAGLYESWIAPDKKPVNTCIIITTEPNDLVKPIHDRMPVIVRKEHEDLWIVPGAHSLQELMPVFKPYPAEEMEMSD